VLLAITRAADYSSTQTLDILYSSFPAAADRMFAIAARLFDDEKELAELAKEDIGEDDGYLTTYMQGGAYILSKARLTKCYFLLPNHVSKGEHTSCRRRALLDAISLACRVQSMPAICNCRLA